MALPVVLENQVEACGRLCAGCPDCNGKEKQPVHITPEWNTAHRPVSYAAAQECYQTKEAQAKALQAFTPRELAVWGITKKETRNS